MSILKSHSERIIFINIPAMWKAKCSCVSAGRVFVARRVASELVLACNQTYSGWLPLLNAPPCSFSPALCINTQLKIIFSTRWQLIRRLDTHTHTHNLPATDTPWGRCKWKLVAHVAGSRKRQGVWPASTIIAATFSLKLGLQWKAFRINGCY